MAKARLITDQNGTHRGPCPKERTTPCLQAGTTSRMAAICKSSIAAPLVETNATVVTIAIAVESRRIVAGPMAPCGEVIISTFA